MLSNLVWRKSSYSTGQDNISCVELATGRSAMSHVIAVRDSKNPDGPVLRFAPAEFRALLSGLRAGRPH